MEVRPMSITNQPSQLHPKRSDISLSIGYPNGEMQVIEEEEEPDTIIIEDSLTKPTTSTDFPVTYVNMKSCSTPRLPSNTTFKIPDPLLNEIKTFIDKNNDIKTRIQTQRLVERVLVESGSCSTLNPSIVNDYRIRLFSIDDKKINNLMGDITAMSANLHADLSCVVDAIIYNGNTSGTYSPLLRERIRNWFPDVKQIGQESVEGYALKSSFTNDSDLFVLKAPRNIKNDEIVHEALVGFYALNKLRHVLPNYMYVYGYTKCSIPAFKNKIPITWCSSSTPAGSYLITENIRDAVPMSEFIVNPNVTANDFMAVFLQLINALNLAYKQYGYTHYDLHRGNVMIRKYPRLVAIPYFGSSTMVIGYIATQYVPYIIDYGYSRISIAEIGFGKIGLENYGIEGERPFPMYDIYKIICSTGETLYTKPQTKNFLSLSVILEKLFSFFNEGTLTDRVYKRLHTSRDWYNVVETYRPLTHDIFINWLHDQSGIFLPVHTDLLTLNNSGVYTAPINSSLDTCEFYKLVTSDQGPQTALEYCETVAAINEDSIMSPEEKQSALTWLNNNFDAETYFKDILLAIINKISEADVLQRANLITDTDIIPLINPKTSNLTTPNFVEAYRNHILALLAIKDIGASIISSLRSNVCSLISQGKLSAHRSNIDKISQNATMIAKFVESQRNILKENAKYARSIRWEQSKLDPEIISFWTLEHENLVLAV